MIINENFNNLTANYLFAEIAAQVAAYKKENPQAQVISLGIGDVTLPLAEAVVSAMKKAADEMARAETFKGYGPYGGYDFLRQSIAGHYARRGVTLTINEVFVGDGAKNDLGGVLDLFRQGITAAIPNPVYPAYLDVNAITGNRVEYIDGNMENSFLPAPPDHAVDLVYLCSPNNPTGAVYTKEGLKAWVDYANACGAVILFDAAYEAFVRDDTLPHSIFEIEGARGCAIELCSFSKTAGFTGVRCGYTVIPKELVRGGHSLRDLWERRLAIKHNGVSYLIQRAAEAVFSDDGRRQIEANISYYLNNAQTISAALTALGIPYVGGQSSPYIWMQCPKNLKSWEVFDLFLRSAQVVCTPGAGFGANGEGWVRLTAFGTAKDTQTALDRISKLF